MSKDHPFLSISEDVRDFLEGGGRRLEAIEGVIGTSAFVVATYRVDYGDWLSFKTPPGIVKLSRKEHAITDSTHIKLGASRYYREYKDDTAGIADPKEGRVVQRGSLCEFRKKNGLPSRTGFENVSSTVTWGEAQLFDVLHLHHVGRPWLWRPTEPVPRL